MFVSKWIHLHKGGFLFKTKIIIVLSGRSGTYQKFGNTVRTVATDKQQIWERKVTFCSRHCVGFNIVSR